jgi:hypothetical protein
MEMAIATKPGNTQDFMNKAQDTAQEAGRQASEKAKDIASNVAGKAKDVAANVGHKAEDATHALGSGMQSLAGTIRDYSPESGVLGTATGSVASSLESSGKYLQQEGLSGIANDITEVIRRNPLPALLVGVGVGFILARATMRS